MPEPVVTIRGLGDLIAALRRVNVEARTTLLAQGIQAGAGVIQDGMAGLAPRRSGFLAGHMASVYSIANGVAEARIGPQRDAFYGGIVNQGAKPHTIRPFVNRKSRRLRGKGRGGRPVKRVLASSTQIFGSVVRHPGVRPLHFMQAAIQQERDRAVTTMARTIFLGIDRLAATLPKGGG